MGFSFIGRIAMLIFALLLGAILVLATLLDAFEVVLLPRPVRRR